MRHFQIRKIRKNRSANGTDELVHKSAGLSKIIVLRNLPELGDPYIRNAVFKIKSADDFSYKHLKCCGGGKSASGRNIGGYLCAKTAKNVSAFDKTVHHSANKSRRSFCFFRSWFTIADIHFDSSETLCFYMYKVVFRFFRKGADSLFNGSAENAAARVIGMVSADFGSSAGKKFVHLSAPFYEDILPQRKVRVNRVFGFAVMLRQLCMGDPVWLPDWRIPPIL